MRTTKGAARTRAKRKLFKRAKGYRGGRRNMLRTVKETLVRAGVFAFRDRRVKKRTYRRLWITRINAAARGCDLSYSQLIHGLKLAEIEVDRKVLADIAVYDLEAFAAIAAAAKAALPAN